jgi:hypothetical protein
MIMIFWLLISGLSEIKDKDDPSEIIWMVPDMSCKSNQGISTPA